jgi:GGDEF domain-containing protein
MARAATELRKRFEAVHYLDCVQTAVQATASIGWAVYPDDGQDFASLMAVADARMYRDKPSRQTRDAQPPAGSDLSTARTGDASAHISRSGSASSS